MMTVLWALPHNILLDPIFIFMLHMGIRGAALAHQSCTYSFSLLHLDSAVFCQ
ncbi:MAG: hypothetical protein ACLR8P_06905 [Clostridium fessum]